MKTNKSNAKKEKPFFWGYSREVWEDIAGGMAAEYGLSQELVDAVERHRVASSIYWKRIWNKRGMA